MDSLFSPQWYRVAGLHPSIRQHIRLHRQVIRDQIWYLLEDQVSGRQHRLDPVAFHFVGMLNGKYSVDDLWQKQLESLGDDAPSQHDIVRLVGQLHQADLVQCELSPDVEELFARQERRKKQRRWGMVNPLSFRTRLIDPHRAIDAIYPRLSWLFNTPAFIVLGGLVLMALFAAARHWTELSLHASYHFHSSNNWMLMWLIFPVMKLLHETSHALAVRHWGGQVTEMGVTMMLLVPIPYVDASAANLFPERHARMMVSASGIFAEMLMASLALLVWLTVNDGMVRDIAFLVMTIGGVSTLLFNGNPLLKFDGYHVLADWLEIPNLAHQSKRYWSWLMRQKVLRVEHAQSPAFSGAEEKWLFVYNPAAWIYRFTIMIALGGWLSSISIWLAAGIVAVFAYGLFIKPLSDMVQYLATSPEIAHRRVKTWLKSGGALLALLLVLGAWPLPYATPALGVVWVPDDARVRTQTDGFVEEVLVNNGDLVESGQLIATLSNDNLLSERDQTAARLKSAQAHFETEVRGDYGKSGALHEEVKLLESQLDKLEKEVASLNIRAETSGVLQIATPADLPGRWLNKGTELAMVVNPQSSRVRAAILQEDAGLISDKTTGIQVRFSDEPGRNYSGILLTQAMTPTNYLPSEALANSAGGEIILNIENRDALETMQPVFLLDVDVPTKELVRTGARAWLRFEHGRKPLLAQWALRWKQLFLNQLGNLG